MRTRLDEIVEEEFGDNHPACAVVHFNAYPECRAAMERATERAFRHGVEQAHGVFAYLDHKNVQPAPAGEKLYWSKHPTWCGLTDTHFGPCDDRRKGERRKGAEEISLRVSQTETVRIYKRDGSIWWRDDRRSGKDRRKG